MRLVFCFGFDRGREKSRGNYSEKGAVQFWFGCVWFSFSQGEGTNFGWLGEEDGGKRCGAREGELLYIDDREREPLWSAGNQEKKTHWWG